ncbi:DJ-1/PfpI family protein (plasmid) [Klebsiella michiganensis]|uniref:DJ-1/PfpI family protein n=1 Tax=Klebsiella TaxID=570 RepID=UPI0013FDF2A9|nr:MULTISPECIES: DJ-1/PfpI family protein [Klebsiella]QSW17773.1 DJ-1/PfpI family protein [Klebsiella michiganensis]
MALCNSPTTIEVFTCATRVNRDDVPLFNVFTVGETLSPVRARAGLKIDPDFSLENHPEIDCLIVPGGVVSAELEKQNVLEWIAKQALTTTITASVCTGAFLLTAAGIMEGKSATTHWDDVTDLRAMFPWLFVKERVRWVDEDEIVTSAGISAGIDMSLHLVEWLNNRELTLLTAKQLEFDKTENQPSV